MGNKYYAAIDLHSNNGYTVIMDEEEKLIFCRRLANRLDAYLDVFKKYRQNLTAIAIESTFNWYWLVDGLMADDYDVRLVHTAGVQQYSGLKNANDKNDAVFLARLLRLGVLPTGHIYPCTERPARDLLRRRLLLVQQRTQQLLSFHSLIYRQTGSRMSCNETKKMSKDIGQAAGLFTNEHLQLMAETALGVMHALDAHIQCLERAALGHVQLKPEYGHLLGVPGVGKILGLTITLETGSIDRFPTVGDYASYCRCVTAKRTSNNKCKGENNRRNGNRYLAWAYIEAANFATRYYEQPRTWYMRKTAKSLPVVARKALAAKLCRACYYVIRDQTPFDMQRLFG
jgi:transposase